MYNVVLTVLYLRTRVRACTLSSRPRAATCFPPHHHCTLTTRAVSVCQSFITSTRGRYAYKYTHDLPYILRILHHAASAPLPVEHDGWTWLATYDGHACAPSDSGRTRGAGAGLDLLLGTHFAQYDQLCLADGGFFFPEYIAGEVPRSAGRPRVRLLPPKAVQVASQGETGTVEKRWYERGPERWQGETWVTVCLVCQVENMEYVPAQITPWRWCVGAWVHACTAFIPCPVAAPSDVLRPGRRPRAVHT